MNDSGVKIEMHLIQNFAPSNLNRDDTGQPKSTYFGGYRRARVSSQCGKRAARDWWRERSTVTVGERTKKLQQLIAERLCQDKEFMKKIDPEVENPDDDSIVLREGIRLFTDTYYAASDSKKLDNTTVLIFIGPDEVSACVQAIKDLWDDKAEEVTKKGKKASETFKGIGTVTKEVRAAKDKAVNKKEPSSVSAPASDETKKPKLDRRKKIEDQLNKAQVSADIALFGRMLAEQPGRNTDGACQVAHPISTHKVDMEMDFYTAVDDLNPAEETGAGMMGIIGFNSACYYRYAVVDRDQLARNLARKTERRDNKWLNELDDNDYQAADKVISAFLESMVYAIPTGKQNSFAAQNLPSFGLFVKRKGGVPLSLANAFAKPVRPTKEDDDLIGLSVASLTKHWGALKAVFGEQGEQETAYFHTGYKDRVNGLENSEKKSVEEAIKTIMKAESNQ